MYFASLLLRRKLNFSIMDLNGMILPLDGIMLLPEVITSVINCLSDAIDAPSITMLLIFMQYIVEYGCSYCDHTGITVERGDG